MRTAFATCHLCDAICGVAVDVEDNGVVAIRGDGEDPFSQGHVCPKVIGLKHVHEDPDRVRRPLRRAPDGTFHEVPWDDALDEAGARLARLQREHGRDAVALYIGNPTAHSYSALLFIGVLMEALRSKNVFSANSLDSLPRQMTSTLLYGSRLLLPIPDIDRTSLLVILGANPAVSNGSVMTAPGVKKRIKAVRERGGRVVVVDPRKNETAALADEHVFIVPGRDVFFLASVVHVLFRDGLVRDVAEFVDNVGAVREAVDVFAPDVTAAVTGVKAEFVEGLARAFAAAEGACLHSRIGTSTQEHGALCSWLVDVIHILTGHFDRAGGVMFPEPPVPLASLAQKLGFGGSMGRWKSRVRGLAEFNGELPTAVLAEEIETPGPGQIKGMVLHAGNPCLSAPNARRVDAAIAGLDTVVAVDLYVNETTRHAHFIFPPTFGLETDHFPLLFHGVAVRNTAHFSPAVLAPAPDSKHDWEILVGLTSSLLRHRSVGGAALAAAVRAFAAALPPRRQLDLLLRLGPSGLTVNDLERQPHGVDRGPLQPRLPQALLTKTKRIDLAPPVLLGALSRLRLPTDVDDRSLRLIGRRDLRSNNSWMHNVAPLVRPPNRCTLLMHPDDAAARGVNDGDEARVVSDTGAVVAVVEFSDGVMRGVVSLPHGWGHDVVGSQQTTAKKHGGVNLNILTDDHAVDAVSGCAAFNGVRVRVERV